MTKHTTTLALVLAALLASGCTGSRLTVEEPTTEQAVLREAPEALSEITVPITVPLSTLAALANESVPSRYRGEEGVVRYRLERSPFRVSASDGQLRITSRLNGRASALGLGVASLNATVTLEMTPRVTETWNLDASDLALRLHVRDATILGGISARSFVSGQLDPPLRRAERQLRNEIASLTLLEDAARSAWHQLCTMSRLDEGIFFHLRPRFARASQPQVDDAALRLHVGVNAEAQISSNTTEPACPFPERLLLEPPADGVINIVLSAYLDYETLNGALNAHAVGESRGEALSVRITSATLEPIRDALLLKVDVAARASGWFGTRTDGALYVVATPTLAADGQSLALENVMLDTSSRSALLAALGEAAEPLLLKPLRAFQLDLSDQYETARNEANLAIGSLSSEELGVDAEITGVRLTQIAVGPEQLRLTGSVVGDVGGVSIGGER